MKKVKVKLKQYKENNRIDTLYFYNGELKRVDSDYLNQCLVCHTTTIDNKDLGEKYICEDCLKMIRENTHIESGNTKRKGKSKNTSISQNVGSIKTKLKLVDYVKYQNLMNKVINERTATILIQLILEGFNTTNKIAQKLNANNHRTIHDYLLSMAKVGMIYYTQSYKDLYDRTWKLSQNLDYTRVEKEGNKNDK